MITYGEAEKAWKEKGERRMEAFCEELESELGRDEGSVSAEEIERCCELLIIPTLWIWVHARRVVEHFGKAN